MKIMRSVLCAALILFLLFTPKILTEGAQQSYVDVRFVRDANAYRGTITLYHIVRHRPYLGSLSNWLQKRADEFEKKHRGSHIIVQGMDEGTFLEHLEHGRRADAYSFFSGSLYQDLLKQTVPIDIPLKEGLFETVYGAPYCYSGYVKLEKQTKKTASSVYYVNDVLGAYLEAEEGTTEEKADTLYLDLRRAGDLIRYKEGFAASTLSPIDNFTDAVCWLGIDRDTDDDKTAVLKTFFEWLLDAQQQQKLNSLGLMSVRSDIHDSAPEAVLKPIFKTLVSVRTVDPFRWYAEYDSLREDAVLSMKGDMNGHERFQKRLRELIR